jgi:hypothetical protein
LLPVFHITGNELLGFELDLLLARQVFHHWIYTSSQPIYYFLKLNLCFSQAPGAYTYNPSYSGGRDQEDCSLRQSQANSSQDPILKKPFTKKGLAEWFKV